MIRMQMQTLPRNAIIGLLLAISLTALPLGGCKKLVEDYEISPNNSETATPELLLSSSEVNLFFIYHSEIARQSSVFMQMMAGTDRQFLGVDKYEPASISADFSWNAYYTNMLPDLKYMQTKAEAQNKWHIIGISKVLQAMALGLITDTFGDAPVAEATQGTALENPRFEPQAQVYQAIQNLLQEALLIFERSDVKNYNGPLAADFIFNGNIARWRTITYMLQARYHNHLSKKDPQGSAQAALNAIDSALANGLNSPANDAKTVFSTAQGQQNFWNSFTNNWINYAKVGKYLVDTMQANSDPRLPLYANPTPQGGYKGYPAGGDGQTLVNQVSGLGDMFVAANAHLPLVTYAEARFIEAEAAFRLGNTPRAALAYNAALEAALSFEEINSTERITYLNAHKKDATTISLAQIMHQKYLASFLQVEAWVDWRRTSFPSLKPANGNATSGKIPRRMPTPQNEVLYNRNAPNVSDITLPVWWDSN